MRGARLLASLALSCLAAASGCRSATGPSLANALESPEAVGRAVVRGHAENDLEALRALAVTEAEFRDLVWPKLPAGRPERNLPMDYVWGIFPPRVTGTSAAGWADGRIAASCSCP